MRNNAAAEKITVRLFSIQFSNFPFFSSRLFIELSLIRVARQAIKAVRVFLQKTTWGQEYVWVSSMLPLV